MSRKRLFIGIELPGEIRERIADHLRQLQEIPASGIRWEKPEKLHITLKFVGDFETGGLEKLVGELADAAAGVDAFDITLARTGVFPRKQMARVMWIGIDAADELAALHERVERGCERMAIPRDTRSFRPHLTLARVKDPAAAGDVIDRHLATGFGPLTFGVDQLALFESTLSPAGSVYSVLERFPMKKRPAVL